jgi:hypothetical protein
MTTRIATLLTSVMLWAAAATLLVGCGEKNDPIAKSEKKDANKPGAIAI